MRRLGASPILGLAYGINPDRLKAYAQADVDVYLDLYPEMVRMIQAQKDRIERIRRLKASNRRNKRMRRHE